MKPVLIILLAILFFADSYAQKLPNIQQGSLRAPANVKIDGKITEWGQQLSAHNSATDLAYSMANDDKKLYLVIQAKDPDVINRIASGGITLSFREKNSPKENEISIQYPVLKNRSNLFFRLRGGKNSVPDTTLRAADSTMRVNNKTLGNLAKWVKVGGIKDLDTLSIYNETGIEAASRFDLKKVLSIEIASPLSMINSKINSARKFTYRLRVNGGTPIAMTFGPITGSTLDAEGQAKLMASMTASADAVNARLSASTDFSGDYTLAK